MEESKDVWSRQVGQYVRIEGNIFLFALLWLWKKNIISSLRQQQAMSSVIFITSLKLEAKDR